jgi:hypothetical protein
VAATGRCRLSGDESQESRPQRLYHYTNATGLLGILRGAKLWATDLRFLNDEQEADYALGQLRSALADMRNPAIDPNHPAHARAQDFGGVFAEYENLMLEELVSPKFPVYLACFCESGDLLSQWRAYGSDHGYAIEFDTAMLDSVVKGLDGYPPSRMLERVHYGHEAAVSLVSTAIGEVSQDSNLGHLGVHAHYMALRLTALLARIKHPGFREEREWRLIAGFEYEDASLVRFRSSPIAIVPYIEVSFPREAVLGIRVGPGRHVAVRQEGVRRLIETFGRGVHISSSELPLRT